MYHFLDFEKSISVLEGKIEELRNISSKDGLREEILAAAGFGVRELFLRL